MATCTRRSARASPSCAATGPPRGAGCPLARIAALHTIARNQLLPGGHEYVASLRCTSHSPTRASSSSRRCPTTQGSADHPGAREAAE
eukprot:scaffold10743_cov31-Phaeocystis_antarctica.AAC.2